jgi:integrase
MGRLLVRRAVARGVVGTPKSGKSREIPLNEKVLAALERQRRLRGELVFCDDAGRMLRKGACKWPLWSACKRAGLRGGAGSRIPFTQVGIPSALRGLATDAAESSRVRLFRLAREAVGTRAGWFEMSSQPWDDVGRS